MSSTTDPQLANLGPSASSPPAFTAETAMAMITQLQQQLAATQKDGRAVVQQLEAERAKNANAAKAVAVSKAKLPPIPTFKGEVGFNVDNWLRHVLKFQDPNSGRMALNRFRLQQLTLVQNIYSKLKAASS